MNKTFNINEYWGWICCSLEEYENLGCYYYFNKETYEVSDLFRFLDEAQQAEINDNKDRYIPLPQWISDLQYAQLVERLNSPIVTKFFQDAKDEKDLYFRYRCFIDWNGLNLSERYEEFFICKDILIKWCNENGIRYTVVDETEKPYNYAYDNDLSNIEWFIDYDELERYYSKNS